MRFGGVYCRVSIEVCSARRACSRASSTGFGVGVLTVLSFQGYRRIERSVVGPRRNRRSGITGTVLGGGGSRVG
jgi:hypothetical protein